MVEYLDRRGGRLIGPLLLADGGQVPEQQQVPVHHHLGVRRSSAGARSQLLEGVQSMIRKLRTRRRHLDVLLGLQDVEDSLQAVLLGDLVEGVGHAAVELDQVRQGAVPQAGDALGGGGVMIMMIR